MQTTVELALVSGDATTIRADVLALKYAQKPYGLDKYVASKLNQSGVMAEEMQPLIGNTSYLSGLGAVAARHVLFINTPSIREFTYESIRRFGKQAITTLAQCAPDTQHIAMTIHGPGFGMDERECIRVLVAGCMEALNSGEAPGELQRITIVERDQWIAKRLRETLQRELASIPNVTASPSGVYHLPVGRRSTNQNTITKTPKNHLFVAMPFAPTFDDVFYKGISEPINNIGYLCERAGTVPFLGDIMEHVTTKIRTSSLVIADLTGANGNVYLEVGYAWGVGQKTMLIIHKDSKALYDVRGHMIYRYEDAQHLNELLTKNLQDILSQLDRS